jgi:hypothetical protein
MERNSIKEQFLDRPVGVIIEQIVTENKVFRFATECQYSNDDERKFLAKDILRKIQNDSSDKSVKARDKISEYSELFNKDKLKKKWFRLSEEQKADQIKLYFEKKIEDVEERKTETEKVLQMLYSDELKTKNVVYDEKLGNITDIVLKILKPKKK